MKLLIGASSSKIFHLKEFANALEDIGIKTKVVLDTDYSDGYPSRKFSHWFNKDQKFKKLIKEFQPDVIFIDRQRHFGLSAIKSKIPLIVHLRGDFWTEIKIAKETIYKTFPKNIVIKSWEKFGEKCFKNSIAIIPICKYLQNITKKYYTDKETFVMYQGIDASKWFHEDGMELKHPCVGLLQGAVIGDKIKEILILEKVLSDLPDVTFYWAGDGPFRKEILKKLEKYKNFKWLGALDYPDKVRKYLSEIDIYALISGLDMSPLSLLEAQLMEKPVIATNVGGIPELMINEKTGFLIERGDTDEIKKKILELLSDNKKTIEMGKEGRKYVEENFNWGKIAEKFSRELTNLLKNKN
jgi:glycosyltransferase involved in cell wall biosynthesis